jgi:hypothetical protein
VVTMAITWWRWWPRDDDDHVMMISLTCKVQSHNPGILNTNERENTLEKCDELTLTLTLAKYSETHCKFIKSKHF